MSKVGAADRSRLLRSKRAELSGIVKSRKRKLREFFAVCENESPIPQLDVSNPDAPPTNPAEAQFLDVTDILKDRLFNESNLPTRRQAWQDSSKKISSTFKAGSEIRPVDATWKTIRLQHDDTKAKNRANTPGAKGDGSKFTAIIKSLNKEHASQGMLMQRSSSKSSQTDFPTVGHVSSNGVHVIPLENATPSQALISDTVVSFRNNDDGQRLGGLGDAPVRSSQKASLASLEDVSQPSIYHFRGLDSRETPRMETITPPPSEDVQERSFRETDKMGKHLKERDKHPSIGVTSWKRLTENLSSPGSTFDAHSATTTARHEASTDTSPENESRYHSNRLGIKKDGTSSPSEFKKLREKVGHAAQHDDALIARKEISREVILKGFSNLAEFQLLDDLVNTAPEEELGGCGSQVKGDCDMALDVIEENDNVGCDPTINNAATLTTAVTGIESEVADIEIRKVLSSKDKGQTPSTKSMEVGAVPFQDICKSNVSIEASDINSLMPSEETQSTEGSMKSAPNLTTPCIMPAIPPKPAPTPPILERRNTRIGSGVLERKTVSEIIGDAQASAGNNPRSLTKPDLDHAKASNCTSRSINLQSITPVRNLTLKQEAKRRSKLSNVIFAQKPSRLTSNLQMTTGTDKNSDSLNEDYFMPLFLANASAGKGNTPALEALLATANKTITTSDAYVPIHENQTAKILKRIYSLQSSHKWSLRQPKRSIEPIRPVHHWDILLQEAAWMRTDFKEERKWKRTVAKNMASACAEWVSSSPEDRRLLQVKTTRPKFAQHEQIINSKDLNKTDVKIASNLSMNKEFEMLIIEDLDEEPCLNSLETVSPSNIFGLRDEDVVFGLRRSPTSEKLLSELPMYGSPLHVPKNDSLTSDQDPDRFWKRPALPLSKYVEGRIRLKLDLPPKKPSRFEYEEEEEEGEEGEAEERPLTIGERPSRQPLLPPESTDVALFDSKYRHILERIRNVNYFRPPSEFQMPLQTFFEYRTASQWTWEEDKELKILVRDYTYNWSLISSILSSKSKSILATGAERRTPWECFERWIELEGLPGDMQKTHYFRLYTSRIENANKTVMNVPPPQNAQGQIQQSRKRSTASVRVERRRNQKHLILIDTMRKLAKKRETTIQKQQHAASMAAIRKAQEVPHVANRNISATTPQDFSRLKYEREEVIKERLLHLQQRQEAQRRAAMAQRNSGANPQQSGLPNLLRPPAGAPMASNGSNSGNKSHILPASNRPHQMQSSISSHPLPDGLRVPGMGIKSMPQAPIQGQTLLSNPSLDLGLVSRAHAISQHQQAILRQQQQQGQIAGQSSQLRNSPPLRINNLSPPGFPLQGNMISPFPSNPNGVSTTPTNPLASPGQASSPQVSQPPQPLSHVQRMEMQYKAKYPGATPEQITNMISQALAQSMQHHQRLNISQNAINAAAGGPLAAMNGVGASQGTPQLYAQMLRQQQESQQKQQQIGALESNFQSNHQSSNGTGNSGVGHTHRNLNQQPQVQFSHEAGENTEGLHQSSC